jgi:regulatory protein
MCATPLSLKGRALQLLSGREHSRAELERKLARFEQEPGSLTRALDELQTKDFISEQRVVDSVLHRRAAKLGSARIQHELQTKGLDPDTVRSAVAALHSTELERAYEVWRKKFSQAPQDAAQHAKQMRFLASRGFSADAIRRVISNPPDDSGF